MPSHPRCPVCGTIVRGALKATTGYVLLLPCGCRGIDKELLEIYRLLCELN